MLTQPVQYSISKHGLVMFKGSPAFPFHHMNHDQRHVLYQVVNSFRCQYHTYSAFASTNPTTYSIENERINIDIPSTKLDPKLVLTILVELIAVSKQPSLLLLNLMIQRLTSRVNICKDTISFANEAGKFTLTKEPGQAPQC